MKKLLTTLLALVATTCLAGEIDLSGATITGTLPVANGGTGLTVPTPVVGSGDGTSVYNLTNVSAAIDVADADPQVTIPNTGSYLIFAQVHLKYNAATITTQTASFKVRRTNNTATDVSVTVVIDLPVSTTLTHSYGIVTLPPFIYNSTVASDVLAIFGNLDAVAGAGNITIDAVGTKIFAIRLGPPEV